MISSLTPVTVHDMVGSRSSHRYRIIDLNSIHSGTISLAQNSRDGIRVGGDVGGRQAGGKRQHACVHNQQNYRAPAILPRRGSLGPLNRTVFKSSAS
jgi:hypothetical protein